MNEASLLKSAFFTGAAGDVALQACTLNNPYCFSWGFDPYFKHHGPVASIFIAAGMVVGAMKSYLFLFGNPSPWGLMAWGMAWDVAFRVTRVMPLLDTYYEQVSPLKTAIWGGLPLVFAMYAAPFF